MDIIGTLFTLTPKDSHVGIPHVARHLIVQGNKHRNSRAPVTEAASTDLGPVNAEEWFEEIF